MEKLTGKQILEKIKNSGISVDNFAFGEFGCPDGFELPEPLNSERKAYNDFYEQSYSERKNKTAPKFDWKAANDYFLEQTGLGKWEEVDQYGGEDQGSTWYSVKHFIDHDVYIRTDGYYQSYNGTDFYQGYGEEVKPVQKTITVFE